MRNFDLTISLPDDCAKTIGEASLDVAHVLMTIAKHSKRLKKWEYISYLKKEENLIDLEKFDSETELAHSLAKQFIKSDGKYVRKYNKDVKVVTEDSSDWAGYRYWYVYKENKDVESTIVINNKEEEESENQEEPIEEKNVVEYFIHKMWLNRVEERPLIQRMQMLRECEVDPRWKEVGPDEEHELREYILKIIGGRR